MPFGAFINQIPPIGFLAIHLAAFAFGVSFARRAFAGGSAWLGWGFALFALWLPPGVEPGAFERVDELLVALQPVRQRAAEDEE